MDKNLLEDPFSKENKKHKEDEVSKKSLNSAGQSFLLINLTQATITVGIFVFAFFLPDMWWSISFSDLFSIASDQNLEIITKIPEYLHITANSSKSWAIQRIFIVIAIALAMLILSAVIFNLIRKNINKRES